jgi:hypothetical protein
MWPNYRAGQLHVYCSNKEILVVPSPMLVIHVGDQLRVTCLKALCILTFTQVVSTKGFTTLVAPSGATPTDRASWWRARPEWSQSRRCTATPRVRTHSHRLPDSAVPLALVSTVTILKSEVDAMLPGVRYRTADVSASALLLKVRVN